MKIAILSDIHANFSAFEAILNNDSFLDCDIYVNAGDSIGYFHNPLEVVSNLIRYKFLSARGNHEDMLSKAAENGLFLKSLAKLYGTGHQIALEQLGKSNLEYLKNLPSYLRIESPQGIIYVYHGTPKNNTEYLYPDFPADAENFGIPEDCVWLILGNTHWPMFRHMGGKTIINPGSVGQPRNGATGAQWAILNTANGDVTFKTQEYEMNLARTDFEGLNLNSFEGRD